MEGLFRAGTSWLHGLHPLTKLAAVALMVVSAYSLPFALLPPGLFLMLVVGAAIAGTLRAFLKVSLGVLLPITVSLFLIQGILFPIATTTPIVLGPLVLYQEGLLFAFVTATRLLVLSSALVLFFQTTHPADLVSALTDVGVPRNIGYILLVSLQLLPYMRGRATAITESQRSRGLETEGSVLRRIRGFLPLAGPLVIGALSEVEERAVALELRAFMRVGPKSSLRIVRDSAGQRATRWLLLLATLGLVGWRLLALFQNG